PATDSPAGVGEKRIARRTAAPNTNPQFDLIQVGCLLACTEATGEGWSAMVMATAPLFERVARVGQYVLAVDQWWKVQEIA
ncbi:hypothetical protein QUT48_22620, partial [Xanthomonas citri pv. citri]